MNNYDEYLKHEYGENYMREFKICNHRISSCYNKKLEYLTLNSDELNNILLEN